MDRLVMLRNFVATAFVLAAALCSPPPASAFDYISETTACSTGQTLITITAADAYSRRYGITAVATNGDVNSQAAALVPFLKAKMSNPTSPSFDATGASAHSSPLGWLILGKSPIGAGC